MNTDEIRARAEAATPAPWEAANKSVRVSGTQQTYSWGHEAPTGCQGGICNCLGRGYGGKKNDPINVQAAINAQFISHAREDIPALLDALEAKERENAELREQFEKAVEDIEYLITHPEAPAEKLCAHWNKYCPGCCCFHGKSCKPEWRGAGKGEER